MRVLYLPLSRRIFCLGFLTSLFGCGKSSSQGDSLPEGATEFFCIFGDSREGNDIYATLSRRSVQAGIPAFAVHLGDMIAKPRRFALWPSFLAISRTFFGREHFYPVVGNHDVNDADSSRIFQAAFPEIPKLGYYTKVVNDCFFVFLNSEDLEVGVGEIGPTQLAWLDEQLASDAARDARLRAVFVHRPLFPVAAHEGTPLKPDSLHALFQTHKVKLVAAGHEHVYSHEERDGIHYVISGGGGSPLHSEAGKDAAFFHYVQVSFFEDYLQFRALDLLGIERDEFKIDFA